MSDLARMTFEQKIEKAKDKNICLPYDLLNEDTVGIYKFLRIKDNEEYCFYIGKSTDIVYRLLGASSGHIYMFLKNDLSKVVPLKINEYLNEGFKIKVEVIKIDYSDISFCNAAHRLALAELQEIVKYQEKGQCQFQVPEGAGAYEEKFWQEKYKKPR